MFKQLAALALQYLNLAHDVLQMKEDFKALRQEVKDLRAEFAAMQKGQEQTFRALERLAYEV